MAVPTTPTVTIAESLTSADRLAEYLVRARGLKKSYARGWRRGRLEVLVDASLTLNRGEIVGLVGENGSGKSTLMKILVGSLGRDGGLLELNSGFGYCPQEPVLYDRLTCDEHFELFGSAYRLEADASSRARDQIYDLLDFEMHRDSRADELSGGTRAKLNLGLALLPDPGILFLDEPYSGFDWDTYLRFWDLAADRRDRGRSVLIISHFVTDRERFDRIINLKDGRTT